MEVKWFEISRLVTQMGLPYAAVNAPPENQVQPFLARFLAVANDEKTPKEDGEKRA